MIANNPKGCVNETLRSGRSCLECYYSQVENNMWTGSQRCWNAQCLVYKADKAVKKAKEAC